MKNAFLSSMKGSAFKLMGGLLKFCWAEPPLADLA
jgi:hypothetical protein